MSDSTISNSNVSTVPTENWPTDEEYELQQKIIELEKQIDNYQAPKEFNYFQNFKKSLQVCLKFLKKDKQPQV